MKRLIAATVLVLAGSTAALADGGVPVTDSAVTDKETNTAKCMERARAFKQSQVTPQNGIKGSVATSGEAGAIQNVGTGNLVGGALSGTSVGGVDVGALLQVAGSAAALKSQKAGQVVNAMAAVTQALNSNKEALAGQGAQVGSVNSIQGGFDQNSAARLATAGVWGQAIQAGSTTLELRNTQLTDQVTAASAASRAMQYDKSKARFIDSGTVQSDNTETVSTQSTSIAQIQAELDAAQAAARNTVTATGSVPDTNSVDSTGN